MFPIFQRKSGSINAAISMLVTDVKRNHSVANILSRQHYVSVTNIMYAKNTVSLEHRTLQTSNFWPSWSWFWHLMMTASTLTRSSPLQFVIKLGKTSSKLQLLDLIQFRFEPEVMVHNNWSKVKLGPATMDEWKNTLHNPNMNFSQPESSPEEIKINLWPRKDILNVRFNQEDLL